MTRALTRRAVIGGVASAAGLAIAGGYEMFPSGDYDRLLREHTRPLGDAPAPLDLVRFATLAANSHNTQAWRFRIGPRAIDILPDLARRTPVVDPDDHHLYVSLGCAAENLSLAAKAHGHSGEVQIETRSDVTRVRVGLAPGPRQSTPHFLAIPRRQCTRAAYDGKSVTTGVLERLEIAARVDGTEPVFVIDAAHRNRILDLAVAGNTAQLGDSAFVDELKSWLRFNERAAAATRDGLFSAASGNPRLPSWLGPILFDLFITAAAENARLIDQVRSSAGLVAIVAPTNDPAGWIAAGRAYQRLALQATVDGLKHAFVNQPVEVPLVRSALQTELGTGPRRPNLLLRFGYGPWMPRSLRRRLEDVVTTMEA